jgi:hypothetical protein
MPEGRHMPGGAATRAQELEAHPPGLVGVEQVDAFRGHRPMSPAAGLVQYPPRRTAVAIDLEEAGRVELRVDDLRRLGSLEGREPAFACELLRLSTAGGRPIDLPPS